MRLNLAENIATKTVVDAMTLGNKRAKLAWVTAVVFQDISRFQGNAKKMTSLTIWFKALDESGSSRLPLLASSRLLYESAA